MLLVLFRYFYYYYYYYYYYYSSTTIVELPHETQLSPANQSEQSGLIRRGALKRQEVKQAVSERG